MNMRPYLSPTTEREYMKNVNIFSMNALQLSREFMEGSISPLEVTELYLERAFKQSSPIYIKITKDRALSEARASTKRWEIKSPLSRLDGVPIAWKDLIDMEGEVSRAASILFENAKPAPNDAPLVNKASAAGMISLGRLNMTELAYSGVGYNPHYGTPKNICSDEIHYVPGGSSSGSGVAVGGNFAPIAIGSDTGGSVRVPAALNGVVGYKSSEGRYETKGVIPLSRTFDTIGPLAKCVSDCIEIDKIFRPSNYSYNSSNIKDPTFYYPKSIVLDDLDKAVESAFYNALDKLVDAGYSIQALELECFKNAFALMEKSGTIVARDAWEEYQEKLTDKSREKMDERVLDRILKGSMMTSSDLVKLHWLRREGMTEILQKVGSGFLLMPTVSILAPELKPLVENKALFHEINLKLLRNTTLGNIFNLPGVSLPIPRVDKNILNRSVGLLVSTYGGRDDELLNVAKLLESFFTKGESL